jgi:hypothetical protein
MKVKLLKDKPYAGKSEYGTYQLFSVEHEGIEKAFFAPDEVVQKISGLGCKAGDEIVLTKEAIQNGKKVISQMRVDFIGKPASLANSEKKDNLKQIMEQCLQEAVEITRSVQGIPFQNEDIQKIASCLFIART